MYYFFLFSLITSLLIVVSFYSSYFLFLFLHRPSKNQEDYDSNKNFVDSPYNFMPSVSVLVPVFNEETIIIKKLENLEQIDYPADRIEMLFIDGNSTDKTCNLITEFSKKSKKKIKLITQETRNGYSGAIVTGLNNSNGDIIIATDAASYYFSDTIRFLTRHFTNLQIGAVTGKEIVCGNTQAVGPKLEKSYRHFYDFMRTAETKIDSTPDSKGEILAVRKNICYKLIHTLSLSNNASFDSCVPYQAKIMGYRTIYDEKAKYYEYAPSSFKDRMTQQIRRASLLIGAMILFKHIIFNKNYGRFGTIIMPIHVLMTCFIPFIFLLIPFSLIILTVINPVTSIYFWLPIIALSIWKKSRLFILSFIQSQIALIVGLFKVAKRTKSLYINTIPSTRVGNI